MRVEITTIDEELEKSRTLGSKDVKKRKLKLYKVSSGVSYFKDQKDLKRQFADRKAKRMKDLEISSIGAWTKSSLEKSKKHFAGNIEKETIDNDNFRKVLFTGKNSQLVVMSLNIGEEIGIEVHPKVDQFFRIEKGKACFWLDGKTKEVAEDGDAIIVPAGTYHNVINKGKGKLKLYTVYSPPNHPDGTINKTKADAEKAEKNE